MAKNWAEFNQPTTFIPRLVLGYLAPPIELAPEGAPGGGPALHNGSLQTIFGNLILTYLCFIAI